MTFPLTLARIPKVFVGTALFGNQYRGDHPLYTTGQLLQITQLLGPLPSRFLANCEARAEYFDESGERNVELSPYMLTKRRLGHLLHAPKVPPMTIEECLDNYKSLKQEELRPAADFIRRCLTLDPSVRPTTKELLEDKWLREVWRDYSTHGA
jgi:serine/threonine protein kinase